MRIVIIVHRRGATSWLLALLTISVVALSQVLGAPDAQAQEVSIAGTVTDESGGVLPGITVAVLGTEYAALTEADGSFEIVGLSAGTYTLITRARGFATTVQPVAVGFGESSRFDLGLSFNPLLAGTNPVVTVVSEGRQGDRVYMDSQRFGSTETDVVAEPGSHRFTVNDPDTNNALCEWTVNLERGDYRCFLCSSDSGEAGPCATSDR